MSALVAVVTGAALGASGRYLLSGWVSRLAAGVFPWGTLTVNWLGCLLIGFMWAVSERDLWSLQWRAFFFVGVLGSFTTFSSFGLETFHLLRDGELGRATGYVLGSNAGGMFLVWVGLLLGRSWRSLC